MCQIIVKEAGSKFDMKKLDKAQGWNEDGYGVSWWLEEEKQLKTFTTMDYRQFKAILSTLKGHRAVAHLRNTTKGITCDANNHPFPIPTGMMFHNGTIAGLTCSVKGGSDTQELASIINECTYKFIDDIIPLLQRIVGEKINRLVFFENDGEITMVNGELGQIEDGIWYSNDYHTRAGTRADTRSYVSYVSDGKGGWVTPAKLKEIKAAQAQLAKDKEKGTVKLTKVFVYGTLKEGENNHDNFLGEATKVGTASTVSQWAMIGEDMPYPYLLERDDVDGTFVTGEVYEVTDMELSYLDSLEGTPHHYKQTQIYVSYADGRSSENVMTYVKSHITQHDRSKPYVSSFNKKTKASA